LLRHNSITPSRFVQNQTCCAERKRKDPSPPFHLISAIWRNKSFDVYPKLSKNVPTYQFTSLNNAWDFAIRYRRDTSHFRFINSSLARLVRHSLIKPQSAPLPPSPLFFLNRPSAISLHQLLSIPHESQYLFHKAARCGPLYGTKEVFRVLLICQSHDSLQSTQNKHNRLVVNSPR